MDDHAENIPSTQFCMRGGGRALLNPPDDF